MTNTKNAAGDEASMTMPVPRPARKTRSDQRRTSRTKLIEAGRAFAIEGKFQTCSLDEVAKLAGLSRAAYYLHFKSKDELLTAILEDQMDRNEGQYNLLTPQAASRKSGVIEWLAMLVEFYRSTGELNGLYWLRASENKRSIKFHDRRMSVVRLLGRRINRLQLYNDDGSIDRHRELKILLHIYQVEQTTFAIGTLGEILDPEAALEELANNFLSLMT